MPEIKLSQGTLQYRDEGSGAPVVMIHGLLVAGSVWDRVVKPLSAHARCIVPDLPLGSHQQAMSPDEIAKIVGETIAETGATSKAQMGAVMKAVQEKVSGRADGKTLSAEVPKQLSS